MTKFPPVQYHDYLQIDKILNSQNLRSEEFQNKAHDEMLFIIVHQAYELWFKQILWELDSVLNIFSQSSIPESQMGQAVHRLSRVVEIQKLLIQQVDVLETMTPLDFLDFRNYLYPASGFQSFQFRSIETKLGLREEDRLNFNDSPFYKALKPEQQTEMQTMLSQKSLVELLESWLTRTPFLKVGNYQFWKEYSQAVEKMLMDDMQTLKTSSHLSEPHREKGIEMMKQELLNFQKLFDPAQFQELQKNHYFRMNFEAIHAALFIQIYRDRPILQMPFQFLRLLVDIDENFTQWRYRHALMAQRMLGKKIGTGGSSGHDYLKSATDKHKVFGDLLNLTTFFIPRGHVPPLPKEVELSLGYG